MKRFISLLACSLLLLNLILCFAAFGQQKQEWRSNKSDQEDSFNIKSASFLLPQPRPKWHYYQNLSFSYIDLPSQWTLQNINAPMLTYTGKFSLPFGFNFQEGLSTLFVSNRFNFGPSWNYSIHNYHFGIGYQFTYDFGYLNGFGYNTTFSGWEENPSVTAGYSFKKIAIILRGDLYWTRNIDVREGGHDISLWHSFENGYSFSGFIEQRLYRKKILQIGIKVNEIRYHFIAWPAFPVNERRYFVPEFQIGINI